VTLEWASHDGGGWFEATIPSGSIIIDRMVDYGTVKYFIQQRDSKGNQVRSSTAWSLDRAKKTAEDWINGA